MKKTILSIILAFFLSTNMLIAEPITIATAFVVKTIAYYGGYEAINGMVTKATGKSIELHIAEMIVSLGLSTDEEGSDYGEGFAMGMNDALTGGGRTPYGSDEFVQGYHYGFQLGSSLE